MKTLTTKELIHIYGGSQFSNWLVYQLGKICGMVTSNQGDTRMNETLMNCI